MTDQTVQEAERYTYSNSSSIPNLVVTSNNNCAINYFHPVPSKEADRTASVKVIKLMYNDISRFLSDIGCFEGIFSFQVKAGNNSFQVPSRYLTYVVQNPFKEKVE